jgi:hypothetical protein
MRRQIKAIIQVEEATRVCRGSVTQRPRLTFIQDNLGTGPDTGQKRLLRNAIDCHVLGIDEVYRVNLCHYQAATDWATALKHAATEPQLLITYMDFNYFNEM